MRDRWTFVFVAALGGCSTAAPPTAPDAAPARAAPAHAEEPALRPSRPTPAFRPRSQAACVADYELVGDTCVHRYYLEHARDELEQALAAYKRGAAPPMLGLSPPPAVVAAPAPRSLDPGALAKAGGSAANAESAKQRRLAELDLMLEAARAKLRERDEAAKAKHVDNAPKKAARADAGLAGAAGGSSDPMLARLNELSQLASQLGSEQMQALSKELGQSGIDTSALDQALRGESGQQGPP